MVLEVYKIPYGRYAWVVLVCLTLAAVGIQVWFFIGFDHLF